MTVLSIDIGIRNLALCVLSCSDKKDLSTYSIKLWGSYDTLKEDNRSCEGIQKNGKICGKKCCYQYSEDNLNVFTCKTHFPKDTPITPKNKYCQKKIKDYTLQELAKAVLVTINKIYSENKNLFGEITCVLIELQPSFAVKMKFISHIIFGKLIEIFDGSITQIKFVRATQKLKVYDGPELICPLKGAYSKRKWLSVKHIEWFLQNKFTESECSKWLPTLEGKGDDSADCLCYCLYYFLGCKETLALKRSRKMQKKTVKNSKVVAII